jgi:acyl-coenzyme A synthetase/AMP-(fatty) acid ligase/pimeloyl-ACP methyl ester carboxylesterase
VSLEAPARRPPPHLDGLDPTWSRLVSTPDLDGVGRTWHVLDTGVEDPAVTLLCVHGNPTWSYVWRRILATAPAGARVVAVDQLDMGYSERTGTTRRLAQRIADLSALTDALSVDGPVVAVAHDWGGPVALGWAREHHDQMAGIVLMNTAVHQPEGAAAPALIRGVRNPWLLDRVCVDTAAFVRGTTALARPRLPDGVREAYRAPYGTPERRVAIGEFVADIPLEPDHPSHGVLAGIAADLAKLHDVPALLLWGPRDPVFSDVYLRDLERRLPHADIHRFAQAGHLIMEDVDVAGTVHRWVTGLGTAPPTPTEIERRRPVWAGLETRAGDTAIAVKEIVHGGPTWSLTFAELNAEVAAVAAGLTAHGVQHGDRVALLVPPGCNLAVVLYACWRIGAVVVVADAGLGVRGLGRAMQSASPDYVVGIPRALAAARSMRWPGERISVMPLGAARTTLLAPTQTLRGLKRLGADHALPPPPGDEDVAAVVFTSGSTGPAKGVVYRHHHLQAQRDALIEVYGITPEDRLVAAFGPFALYGPAMGIPSMVPEMDVTSPGTLRATALADAVAAIGATLVFGSPAALASVAETAGELVAAQREALRSVRLLMSAGAPVHPDILRRAGELMPNAEPHTPYGMTEVLPVADITLRGIEDAGSGNGVCVGHPLGSVTVKIAALGDDGTADAVLTDAPMVTGEVCIRAPHVKERYDKLWATQRASEQPPGWHRSGDVGHLDGAGRLWIEGRLAHVITTAAGPVTPVGIEHAVEALPDVVQAAVVGVGPAGTQQVVVAVRTQPPARRPGLAPIALADQVRDLVAPDVAAVLVVPSLPVDKRHNSKIHRTRIAQWAADVLAGGRMRKP